MIPPRATYRLQLRNGIGFREASGLVAYLAKLGISHVYCSPYVEACAGSTHGYDVVDPTRLDPALGSEADFDDFAETLRRHEMGQILDWVPNHVGVAHGENTWWQEVLAFGTDSPYADFFDIDWNPARRELRGRVLLPVLGAPYGEVLERGELQLERDSGGGLVVRYFDHSFPVSPTSWGRWLAKRLLSPDSKRPLTADPAPMDPKTQEALEAIVADLTRRSGARRTRVERALRAQARLAELLTVNPSLAEEVDAGIAELGGRAERAGRAERVARGEAADASQPPERFDALHRLLEAQHYRLAYWRVAAEEINYRRFFDINELVAVRMERDEVFDHTHETVFRWIDTGRLDGLRIDHVDGLADPGGYLTRLRRACPGDRLYLLVEKILEADEELPETWPVDGTTGYEFLNELNGLFVDPAGKAPLTRLYHAFTGDRRSFEEVLRASKLRVMRALLASELDGLANALDRLAQSDRHTRDFTLRGLRDALADIVAAFPVYRSYVGPKGARGADVDHIRRAVAEARGRSEDPESGLFDWIERVLLGAFAREATTAVIRRAAGRFVTRFEQLTAPVMAKGLEDTSFYRFPLLLSLNEVGGDPRRFGVDLDRFHAANRARAERRPLTLLSTSTHDTKRGEDVRARIDVLSERPAAWRRHVEAWARLNRKRRRNGGGGTAPAPKDEYFLYQTLLGSFPLASAEPEALADYCSRIQTYMVKALREGKERSSWRHPNVDYEQAVEAFVADLLSPGSEFLEAFLPFEDEIASLAVLNGLSQLVLKLSSPGVPDIYQGCEGWDLSLADPDNRGPVDFEARSASLEEISACVDDADRIAPGTVEALRDSWRDGRIKHWISWRLLTLRQTRPKLFAEGSYLPAVTSGERAGNLVAFARTHKQDAMLVVVPRLAAGLPRPQSDFPLGRDAWGDTRVTLPDRVDSSRWHDRLCGRPIDAETRGDAPGIAAASLFETLPLTVLLNDAERG